MNSIKNKFILIVSATVCVFICLLIAANLFVAKPYFTYEKKTSIEQAFDTISKNYTSDAAEMSNLLVGHEQKNGLQIELFDYSGKLVYTTGRKMNQGYSSYKDDDIKDNQTDKNPEPGIETDKNRLNAYIFGQTILSTEAFNSFHFTPTVQKSYNKTTGTELLSLKGIISSGQEYIYVLVYTPLTAIEDTVSTFIKLSAYVAAVVLLCGCIIGYILSDKLTKPIRRVNIVAKHVAALDFSMRADVSSKDEIGNLATSINTMSDQLEKFINEIMEKNRLLSQDNERLSKLEDMRKEFVANVSHDLKSPLAVIGGYAEMLRDMPNIDVKDCCNIIMDETTKMNGMIRSMLDVSAIEHGLKQLELSYMDVSPIATETLDRFSVLAKKSNIDYISDVEPDCYSLINSEYLEQAMKNYIQNAISHVSVNGKISTGLKKQDKEIIFYVYNTGDKIPEDKLNKIWESFYKANEARTRTDDNNAGLGLYIVKSIITAHHGNVFVKNTDNGVEFSFSVPLVDSENKTKDN